MFSRLRPRLTYANVISTLCLFMLLGGGAYAASSFVGSDGQIHGCVSAHGQLKLIRQGKHCKHSKSIAWNRRGRRGQAGQRGPSDAYGVYRDDASSNCGPDPANYDLPTCHMAPLSLRLPRGAYFVSAKARVEIESSFGNVGTNAACRLDAGSASDLATADIYNKADASWPPATRRATLAVQLLHSFAANSNAATLMCGALNASTGQVVNGAVHVYDVKLTAVRVGAVHYGPG